MARSKKVIKQEEKVEFKVEDKEVVVEKKPQELSDADLKYIKDNNLDEYKRLMANKI